MRFLEFFAAHYPQPALARRAYARELAAPSVKQRLAAISLDAPDQSVGSHRAHQATDVYHFTDATARPRAPQTPHTVLEIEHIVLHPT
jgi:hypothetical protein